MKIISWNVNGIRACAKKGLLEFIKNEDPDIFCVQETKAQLEQVENEIKSLGYPHYYWSSAQKKGYSGVATFCKKEPLSVTASIGFKEYENEGRTMITDHRDFLLYNIYFPNGGSGKERHLFKQEFLGRLNRHLEEVLRSRKEIIVVGDYNVAHTEMDIHDPIRLAQHSGFLPEEREWFSTYLNVGFIDTFRQLNPDKKNKYTWWDYRTFSRISNKGWRIDYICVSNQLSQQIKAADILDQVEGSDHCPVSLSIGS